MLREGVLEAKASCGSSSGYLGETGCRDCHSLLSIPCDAARVNRLGECLDSIWVFPVRLSMTGQLFMFTSSKPRANLPTIISPLSLRIGVVNEKARPRSIASGG